MELCKLIFSLLIRVRTCIQCFLLIRTLLQDLRYGNAKVSTCSTSSRKLCGIPFLMPLERNYFSMLLLRMFVFGRDLFIVESFSICIINHTLILYDLVDSQSSFPLVSSVTYCLLWLHFAIVVKKEERAV